MTKFLNVTPLQVEACFDVVSLGNIEGEAQHGNVHRVVVTLGNGRRFTHVARFVEHAIVEGFDEFDRFDYVDVNEAAPLAAQRLAERVRAAGRIDLANWNEGEPAYASDAYVAQGCEFDRYIAEREAEGIFGL
ncbi:MAG: hypothetical protein ACOYB0_08270 [Polynucleobacter sp.]